MSIIFGVNYWAYQNSGSWLRLKQQLTLRQFQSIGSDLRDYHDEHGQYPKSLQELYVVEKKSAKQDSPSKSPEKKAAPAETKTRGDKTNQTGTAHDPPKIDKAEKTPKTSTPAGSDTVQVENPILKAKTDQLKTKLAEEEKLAEKEKLDHRLSDAWSNPIQYESDGTSWRLLSHGLDGLPGGIGLAADLDWASETQSDDISDHADEFYRDSVPTFDEVVKCRQLHANMVFWTLFGLAVGVWACLQKNDKPKPKTKKEWIILILTSAVSVVFAGITIWFVILVQSTATGH